MARRCDADRHQIEALGALARCGHPTLDPEQQPIAEHIYRLIAATARLVTMGQIAESSGVPTARVEESLSQWPLVLCDGEDRWSDSGESMPGTSRLPTPSTSTAPLSTVAVTEEIELGQVTNRLLRVALIGGAEEADR